MQPGYAQLSVAFAFNYTPVIQNVISLFFPPVCSGCDGLLTAGEVAICAACRHNLPLTNFHLLKDNEAFGKFYGRIPVEHVSALCYYHKKGIVQQMIQQLKYRGQEAVGRQLGLFYGHLLRDSPTFLVPDAIVPVPLHKRRLRQRGYNQVMEYAHALSEVLEIPVRGDLLSRVVYAKTQTRKNLFQRALSHSEIFQANFTERDHGMHLLVVDDVITTGATLEGCGRALLKIPGSRISIACMAYAHS